MSDEIGGSGGKLRVTVGWLHSAFAFPWIACFFFSLGLIFPLARQSKPKQTLLVSALTYLFDASIDESVKSIPGAIVDLFFAGNWLLGGIVFCFCIIFPLAKLSVLLCCSIPAYATFANQIGRTVSSWILKATFFRLKYRVLTTFKHSFTCLTLVRSVLAYLKPIGEIIYALVPKTRFEWLETVGPWSMLDVFVLAILILTAQDLPLKLFEIRLTAECGLSFFVISIFSAMVSVGIVKVLKNRTKTTKAVVSTRQFLLYISPIALLVLSTGVLTAASFARRNESKIAFPRPVIPFKMEIRSRDETMPYWHHIFVGLGLSLWLFAVVACVVVWIAEWRRWRIEMDAERANAGGPP